MRVERARAKYIPALNSYFLTDFGPEVSERIKYLRSENLGGDKYLGKGVWEVSQEIWERISFFPHTLVDNGVERVDPTVFRIEGKGDYRYQELGAQELRNRTEALLFFDTGTGKTRTVLLALSRLAKDEDAVISVGIAGLCAGWYKEALDAFPELAERMVVLNTIPAIKERIKKIDSAPKGSIFVMNIESARSIPLVEALNRRELAVCVIDECHYMLGRSAKQTEGMHNIQSYYRWALSATPILNSPIEWYSLLGWLRVVPSEGAKTRFRQYYATERRDKFGRFVYDEIRNEEDLQDLIDLVTIRVEKEGMGLPERKLMFGTFSASQELKSIYNRIEKEKKRKFIDTEFEIGGERIEVKSVPKLFYVERVATAIAEQKIKMVMETEEPVVVVSCLKTPLNFIHSLIPESSVLYTGDKSKEEREEAMRKFISGEKKIFLMSRKCGGAGLDGLQKVAREMIVLDAPENMPKFNQCADRIHRIGQEREVHIRIPKIENSLDDYAWENAELKMGWVDRYYKVRYENEV